MNQTSYLLVLFIVIIVLSSTCEKCLSVTQEISTTLRKHVSVRCLSL